MKSHYLIFIVIFLSFQNYAMEQLEEFSGSEIEDTLILEEHFFDQNPEQLSDYSPIPEEQELSAVPSLKELCTFASLKKIAQSLPKKVSNDNSHPAVDWNNPQAIPAVQNSWNTLPQECKNLILQQPPIRKINVPDDHSIDTFNPDLTSALVFNNSSPRYLYLAQLIANKIKKIRTVAPRTYVGYCSIKSQSTILTDKYWALFGEHKLSPAVITSPIDKTGKKIIKDENKNDRKLSRNLWKKPYIKDNILYILGEKSLYKVNLESGQEEWVENELFDQSHINPIYFFDEGVCYYNDDNFEVFDLDLNHLKTVEKSSLPIPTFQGLPDSVYILPESKTEEDGFSRSNDTDTIKIDNKTLKHHSVIYSSCLSQDKTYLLSGTQDGSLYLWDLNTGTHEIILKLENSRGIIAIWFGKNRAIIKTGAWEFFDLDFDLYHVQKELKNLQASEATENDSKIEIEEN